MAEGKKGQGAEGVGPADGRVVPIIGDPEDQGPVGPFPSWKWVYGTVLGYGALVIIVLWILTRLLDPTS